MPVQLWGTFSVIDHIDTAALVADVLLYDRLIIPCPPPTEEAYKEWCRRGWKPRTQARILRHIEGLYEPVFWDEGRRKRFQELTGRAPAASDMALHARAELGGYMLTQDMLRGEVETSLVQRKQQDGFGPEDIKVVSAYRSGEAFRRDFIISDPVPVPAQTDGRGADGGAEAEEPAKPGEKRLPDREAEIYRLVSRKLMLPADKDPEDALKRAVDLAKSEDYQRHRRRFHEYIDLRMAQRASPMADRVALEDGLTELEKLEREAFKSDKLELMTVVLKSLTGLTGGPFGLASGLLEYFGYFKRPTDAVPPGPFAMFHDARQVFRNAGA